MDKQKLTNTQKREFKEMAEICNTKHLEVCDCQKSAIDLAIDDIRKRDSDKREELKDDKIALDYREIAYVREAKKFIAKLCVDERTRCPIETREIMSVLEIFMNRYDFSDPRVFMIIKSVVNHTLSSHRMQKFSNFHGVVQELFDRNGNMSLVLNPVESSKQKFDESIVKAIEVLNRVIDGNKTSVTHDGKIDLRQVLEAIEAKTIDQIDTIDKID